MAITCREALSAPGFAAWLVRNYPDYSSLDFNNPADEAMVVKWYLARAVCKEAVPAIRQACREILPAEFGLSNYSLSKIDKLFDKMVIETPERVSFYYDKASRWMEIPREIKELEEQFAEAGGDERHALATLEHDAVSDCYDLRKNVSMFPFLRTEREKEVMEHTESEWRERCAELGRELNKFADIEKQILALKKERQDLRMELLAFTDILEPVIFEIRTSVARKLIDLTAGWGDRALEELEAAQRLLDRMTVAGVEDKIDYLTDINSAAQFQQNLDGAFKDSLKKHLKKRLSKKSLRPEAATIPAIEAIIKPVLARKLLGSLRDADAQMAVRDAVAEVMEDLGKDVTIGHVNSLLLGFCRTKPLPPTP